jgi:O-6-methylguanine DNA methyltransferase
VAARIGSPGSARAVGQALGRNPFALIVPCHRVLAADGKLGGFSANGGVTTKARLLSIERASGAVSKPVDESFAFDAEAATRHLANSDERLGRLVEAVGPFRMELKSSRSVFTALAEAIVYQQLNGKAAATIFGRVSALYPGRAGMTAERVLETSDEHLRGAGLSRSKLLSLRDLATKVVAGDLPTLAEARQLSDDALVERLTEVRGVGRWTAEMFLMFRLGRADVLPLDDYGVRQGFAIAFGKRDLPTKRDLERRGERWKPFRTVASWYLWRAVERGR